MSRRQDSIAMMRKRMKEFGHFPENGREYGVDWAYECKCKLCSESGFVRSRRAGMTHRYWSEGIAVDGPCVITHPKDEERNPCGYWNDFKDRYYTNGEMRKKAKADSQ